jgi:Zn-dependent protease
MSEFVSSLSWTNLLIIPSLLLVYTVHELAHGFTAYFLGDTSQVERGRLTLNPIPHIAWFGALAFILFGIGWPKPLHVNPYNFKRKFLDTFLVAAAGPLATLILGMAGVFLIITIASFLLLTTKADIQEIFSYLTPIYQAPPETLGIQAVSLSLTWYIIHASFWLTVISVIPLPGLDGFVAVVSLVGLFREGLHPTKEQQQSQLESTVVTPSTIMLVQQKRRNNAADIHFKMGTDYHQADKYDDAIARYRQAISNDQHFGPAYINMGLAYLAKGERKRAIQAFRGATQSADDKRSQDEAWLQLHRLSEITPIDETAARKDMAELGDLPWTDTKPRPNWLSLGVTTLLILVGALFVYGLLVIQLVNALNA